MAKEGLHSVQIHPAHDQPRGKRVAEIMEVKILKACESIMMPSMVSAARNRLLRIEGSAMRNVSEISMR